MLVLTRRIHERTIIFLTDGRPVVIEVLESSPGRVRLGIDAPQDVTVHREEIMAEIGSRRTEPKECVGHARMLRTER